MYMKRTCIKCGIEQDLEQFLKEKTKDGRGNRCKTCVATYLREYHRRNKEKHNENSRKQYYKNKTPFLERSKRRRENDPEGFRNYFNPPAPVGFVYF